MPVPHAHGHLDGRHGSVHLRSSGWTRCLCPERVQRTLLDVCPDLLGDLCPSVPLFVADDAVLAKDAVLQLQTALLSSSC